MNIVCVIEDSANETLIEDSNKGGKATIGFEKEVNGNQILVYIDAYVDELESKHIMSVIINVEDMLRVLEMVRMK